VINIMHQCHQISINMYRKKHFVSLCCICFQVAAKTEVGQREVKKDDLGGGSTAADCGGRGCVRMVENSGKLRQSSSVPIWKA
jgi:hypothetical protein